MVLQMYSKMKQAFLLFWCPSQVNGLYNGQSSLSITFIGTRWTFLFFGKHSSGQAGHSLLGQLYSAQNFLFARLRSLKAGTVAAAAIIVVLAGISLVSTFFVTRIRTFITGFIVGTWHCSRLASSTNTRLNPIAKETVIAVRAFNTLDAHTIGFVALRRNSRRARPCPRLAKSTITCLDAIAKVSVVALSISNAGDRVETAQTGAGSPSKCLVNGIAGTHQAKAE
jgi:hypothetical protein